MMTTPSPGQDNEILKGITSDFDTMQAGKTVNYKRKFENAFAELNEQEKSLVIKLSCSPSV